MRISYRQGLISAQSNFLQSGQQDSRYVDLIVSPTPVVVAFANGNLDYLIQENTSVQNAWGPFEDSRTYYLYWDISPKGVLSRGATTLSPIVSASAPATVVGQMWWDSTSSQFKLWDGTRWVLVIRVLAGTLSSGSILIPVEFESQVGLNTPVDVGFILKDSFGNIYKDNKGAFLTSSSELTSSDTGSLVKFDGAQITVQANESIPKFTLVYLAGGRASIASGIPPDNILKAPLGIIIEDTPQNAAATVITSGKTVFNDQWNWAITDLGKAVYCDGNGKVVLNKPVAQKSIRVGTIITTQSVLLHMDWETEAATVTSGVTSVYGIAPIVITGTVESPVVTIARSTALVDGYLSATDFARIPAVELALTTKSDIGHLHIIGDVSGLQSALNNKADINHTHAIADVIDLQTTLNGKAPLIHTHTVSEITDIQPIFTQINSDINAKIPKVAGVTNNFPSITAAGTLQDSNYSAASFALAVHTHAIADVVNLQATLNNKTDIGHTQPISSIIDLQTTLNGKAAVVHTHAIADVVNLQATLNNKSDVGHIHTILDVTGLQPALNNKSDITHTHALDNLSDVSSAAAVNGQFLMFNGTEWVPQTASFTPLLLPVTISFLS